jgi:hypothetical protein
MATNSKRVGGIFRILASRKEIKLASDYAGVKQVDFFFIRESQECESQENRLVGI